MYRPLEGHDQRVLSAELTVSPDPAAVRQIYDVSGNNVTVTRFQTRSDRLVFESRVRLEHRPQPAFADGDGDSERLWPGRTFTYDPIDMADLATSIARRFPDAEGDVAAWAQRFVRPAGTTSLGRLLSDMTHAIRGELAYGVRLDGHPQAPEETLALGRGSCRDFAVLMIEACRSLGLAARFTSGYIYSGSQKAGRTGGGHTHAWARVYLPSRGWVEFDPTNGIVGNTDLVRVAVASDPRQALPLYGTWAGKPGDYLGMDVTVDVSAEAEPMAQPVPRLRVAQGA